MPGLDLWIETWKKLSKNPIYDTNWCDMPSEIKSKCIGKMEFKERLSLRCTAKAERSLVDLQKIEFQKEIIVAILKNTKNEFESIKFEADHDNDFPIDEILATPQIQNAKYWHIRCYDKKDTLRKVAQVWIDKNSVIGSTFQLYSWLEGPFDEFLEHFAERIVSKSEERVRIRTDNADRHILLEWGWNPILKVHFELDNYFRLLVISADIKESEYDDDCIGWIRKIHPNPDIDYNYFP
ncbi:unnamed protein product [Caenorhabditis nigoni]